MYSPKLKPSGSFLLAVLIGAASSASFAHDGEVHAKVDILRSWSFDPFSTVILLVSGATYLTGVSRLWNAAGAGSGISKTEAAFFAAGWMSLVVALVSPLHPLGEVLFSAHMTQHEILMLVSAPLLVLGRPQIAAMWALPRRLRRPVGGVTNDRRIEPVWHFLSNAAVAWIIHTVALWIWHIPALFQATLESDLVHTLQHASFFLSALLFWWAIIFGRRGIASYGAGVLYLFTTSIQSGLLGVFLTLTSRVWYPVYSTTTAQWGMTPIEDQQLGGLIMWIPAGLVYIVAALIMFAAWLRDSEKRASLSTPVTARPAVPEL